MMDYSTENLYIAAALLTAGKKLIKPHRNGKGKVLFYFDDDGEIQELVSNYFSGELCLPISLFVNNWRNLRRLIDTV